MASAEIEHEDEAKRTRLVIVASTLGTVFEWYDFFIYGTLAAIIGRTFFPASSETAQFLLALASFGVGFGVRPIGAALFGYLGDRLGRKYTFLVTIMMMGLATAAIGLVPGHDTIGNAAPAILVLLRVLQGLAMGGEYGGAAIYVAEHAPRHRRGFFTSFIQAGVIGGFLLSLAVVLVSEAFVDPAAWAAWGWRLPFLFSIVLLAISLWVRVKLRESPVFAAMKAEGTLAANPLRETFATRANTGRVLVALFGIAAGVTVIWYTNQFQAMYFLQIAFRVEDSAARLIIGAGTIVTLFWFVLFGWLSDRIGRKKPIVIGYALTLAILFPLFHWMGAAANPALAAAQARAPVIVRGSDCAYNPFAKAQDTACGRLLDALSRKGVAYAKLPAAPGAIPEVTIGGTLVDALDPEALEGALKDAGYPRDKTVPDTSGTIRLVLAICVIGMLAGMTFGPVAALLVEMFPARIRYTSMSIPYHVGTGYFGGFLPFIGQYVVARTGDPFAGLWYTFGVVAMALIVSLIWLPETAGKELD